jgi:hypothetical protein
LLVEASFVPDWYRWAATTALILLVPAFLPWSENLAKLPQLAHPDHCPACLSSSPRARAASVLFLVRNGAIEDPAGSDHCSE